MDASVFISFAAQDRKVATTLCSALESRGFKCWISARDILPGENFQVAIVRAIRKAKLMLLVFTANSNNSEEMNKELALASQQKLTVVPLRIEDVAPNDAFRYEFATRQWIDFFADWELAMDQLSSQIANVLGPMAPETPAPVQPAAATATAIAEPVAKVEPPAPEPAKAAPAAAPVESAKPEPAKFVDATIVAPAKPEPAKPEPAKSEPGKPEPAKAGAAAKVEPPKTEPAKPGAAAAAPAAAKVAPVGPSSAVPPRAAAPAKKGGVGIWIGLGVVVVLAAVAGVAAMTMLGKKPVVATAPAHPGVVEPAAPPPPTVTINTPSASPAATVPTAASVPTAAAAPSAPSAPSLPGATPAAPGATPVAQAVDPVTGLPLGPLPPKAHHAPKHDHPTTSTAPARASRSDVPY